MESLAKNGALLAGVTVSLLSCNRPAPVVPYDRSLERVIAGGFLSPQSMTPLFFDGEFIVSHLTSDGKGALSRVTKGKTELLLSNLKASRGVSFDERRYEIYVVDGNTVKIIKLRKPDAAPAEIVVPAKGMLNDVAYSLMNRRAYVTDSADNSIWAINPDKKSAELVIGPEAFVHLHVGSIFRLIPTTDGKRLFVTTTGESPALVVVGLRDRSVTVRHRFEGKKGITGFAFYRDRYLIAEIESGWIEAFHTEEPKAPGEPISMEEKYHPLEIAVDLSALVILDLPAENGPGRLVQVPLAGRLK